jgi:transposase
MPHRTPSHDSSDRNCTAPSVASARDHAARPSKTRKPSTPRRRAHVKTLAQKQARVRKKAAAVTGAFDTTPPTLTAATDPPATNSVPSDDAPAETLMPEYQGSLPVVQRHAAGIDIGSRSHWVCVGPTVEPREFPAFTAGLKQIVTWLRDQAVSTVAMESTGVYWIPLYELLEQEGFEVLLVDPSYTKQVKGRPKTDRLDCQWIQRLHAHGLLSAAFRPDEPTCVLRSYLRQRANHVRYAGQHTLHMQKALEQMNLKLREVINDITGLTGLSIIQAILNGERDPVRLAQRRDPRCKNSEATIAQALTGSYREEHVCALRQGLEGWEFYQKQIQEIDQRIEQQLQVLKKRSDLPPLRPRSRVRRKHNEPQFDVRLALYYVLGIDLTELEGVSEMTALTVISEIGTDMTRWQTVKHFCSWLGVCPQFKKTGGRVKSSRTRPGVNRAAAALCLAASSLHRSHGALGAYLRRMKSHVGAPKAVTATAHKLARLIYYSLRYGLQYVRESQEVYEAQQRARQVASLKRKAKQLGLELVQPIPAEWIEVEADSAAALSPSATAI